MTIFLVRYLYDYKVVTQLIILILRVVFLLTALIRTEDTSLVIFNGGSNSAEK